MASDEAKPASPVAADSPANDTKDPEPETKAEAEAKGQKQEAEKTPHLLGKKRGWRKKGEVAAEKMPPPKKAKPGIERPSRERKTVERYLELARRVTLSRNLLLFSRDLERSSRTSPMVHLKRNISQFSGFVWTDNQENT